MSDSGKPVGAVRGIKRPGGKTADAELGRDGKWHCPDADLERELNVLVDPAQWAGPEWGHFGGKAVAEAAKQFGGTPEFRPPPDGPPGTVY